MPEGHPGNSQLAVDGDDRRLELKGPSFHQVDIDLTAGPATALTHLPPPPSGFVGRDTEIADISAFLGPGSGAHVLVLTGVAGAGKTALAFQASQEASQRGWYRGGVIFIDLHGHSDSRVDSRRALDAFLRALGMPAESIPAGAGERAGLYQSILAKVSEPILLIADNASSGQQVLPLIPESGPHRMIVTSRRALNGLQQHARPVGALDDSAEMAVLGAATPDGSSRLEKEEAAALRLAGLCDGLPLALRMVAALLNSGPARQVTSLADDLAAERSLLERTAALCDAGPSVPSVAAAAALAYRSLDEDLARVFRLMPLHNGPRWPASMVASLAGLPLSAAREVLAGLGRACLIEEESPGSDRWLMDDQVRLGALHAAADSGTDDAGEARDRLLAYYLYLAQAADRHLRHQPGAAEPEHFASELEATAWLDAERPNLVAAVKMAARAGRHQVAMHLPIVLSQYLYAQRYFDDLLMTMSISVAAARELGDHSNEAAALTTLGVALQATGRLDAAVTAQLNAAAILREAGDRHGEGRTLTNLALTLQKLGRFEGVAEVQQAAVAAFRETGDRHAEASGLNTLGLALRRLGRFEAAARTHRDSVSAFQETGDRHGEARALANLGLALHQAGRLEEAVAAQQGAAAAYRETRDRHGEGTAMTNLGLAYHDAGRLEDAVAAQQEAAAAFQETGDQKYAAVVRENLEIVRAELEGR